MAALVLAALFQFVANQGSLQRATAKIEERALTQEIAAARLSQLFSSKPQNLFTHEKTLLLQSRLEIDPDPDFNGLCWCQITHKDGVLQLHRWSFDRKKSRSETLLQNVTQVEWEFWEAPKWRSDWPKTISKTPPMIRFKALRGQEKIEFAFLLDLSRPINIRRDV